MANSRFYQFLYNKQAMMTMLEGSAVILGSGAVGTVKGAGVTSVTRLSTGTYQILFQEPYNRYLGGSAGFVSPSAGTSSGIMTVEVLGDANTTINTSTPTLTLQCFNAAGSLADPASGSVLGFITLLRNSSVTAGNE